MFDAKHYIERAIHELGLAAPKLEAKSFADTHCAEAVRYLTLAQSCIQREIEDQSKVAPRHGA